MKRGIAKKVMALGMAACMTATMAVAAFPPVQLRAEGAQTAQGTVTETYSNERLDNGYTKVSAGYTLTAYTGEPIRYKMGNVYRSGDASLITEYGYVENGENGVGTLHYTGKPERICIWCARLRWHLFCNRASKRGL